MFAGSQIVFYMSTCHTDVVLLYWLPMNFTVLCKILVLTFRAPHGQAPAYINEFLHQHYPQQDPEIM